MCGWSLYVLVSVRLPRTFFFFFFFNDTATTEIYTLSLHDALPISPSSCETRRARDVPAADNSGHRARWKSTRLNSSHPSISYAVFCLKKKKKQTNIDSLNTYAITTTHKMTHP